MEFSTKNRENKDKIHSNFFATALCAAFLFVVSLGAFGQTITINDVTAVNDNEALIGGTTTDIADNTTLFAYYGTENDQSTLMMGNSGVVNGGSFQINVTGLQSGTTYYFQVRDDAEGTLSNIYEFQTSGSGNTTYTVTTMQTAEVSSTDATLIGTVTPYISATIDKVGFIYSSDPTMLEMMVQQITIENTMSGDFVEGFVVDVDAGEFRAQLNYLMPDADYYYQACVQANGEWIVANSYESFRTEGATSNPLMQSGDYNNHGYVDLGLSVKWATVNVGATSPEEEGNLYSWGGTETKSMYEWINYEHGEGYEGMINKYFTDVSIGVTDPDNLTTLLPEDDAVTVSWGAGWRMPTADEVQELIDNCTIEGSTITGNGNSITLNDARYWTSSLYLDDQNNAYLYDNFSGSMLSYAARYNGYPVRGVYDATLATPIVTTKASDNVTETTAILQGSYNNDIEIPEAFSFGFLYGTDTTATLDEVSATFDGSTYYIAEVTGLSSGTTYYFKFFAENSNGRGYGQFWEFETQGAGTANTTNSDGIIYQCDFESGSEDNWPQLNNGDQTNYWTIGFGTSDATTTDTHSLYITNDGSSYSYNSGAESSVYAYKEISLPARTNYRITFDWKCTGENNYDFLRAFLIPTSENPNLSAGNVIGTGYQGANTTPDGWIDISYGQMASSDNQWQQTDRTMALSGGNYYLVFYWHNDGSSGSNPPAAVDNIFFYKLKPISVTANNVTDKTSTSATLNGSIAFIDDPENIAAGFKWGNSQTSLSNNLTTQSTGETFSAQLTDLTPQTAYYYRAYAVYDGDTAFSDIVEFRTALDENALGGANNPLTIDSESDWQDFTEALGSYTIGTQYKGVVLYNRGQDIYFKLTSDLTFSSTFSLNSSPFFQGHLDGDGKSISFVPNQTFGGLFSSIDYGSVDNLNIIITDSPSLDGTHLLGMLSAKSMEASISNCTVSGVSSDVVFTSNDYEEPVGGLVGYATQTTISGCTNNLKITSDVARVGGIAGKADGTIMYCTNNAELSGAYVGGIMAEGAATITNCLNTGRINCSDEYAGGISGSGGNISTCMNIGEISATGTKKAGGIVGNAESATVTNCANYGAFTSFSSNMGGIAGFSYGNGTFSHNVSAPIFRGTEAPEAENEIHATVGGSTGDETDDFFDEQLGDIKVDSLRLRFIERGTRKTSNEMVGSALSTSLSSEYWDFTEGVYPKPKNITETPQTLAARIPIYLSTHEYYGRQQSVFGVWSDFLLPTTIDGQPVTWESDNTSTISISNGTATVNRPADTDVSVMLTASYQGYSKWLTLTVIGPKHIPVNTNEAWQDSVISLRASFDDQIEGVTYVYDYGFQYSTTSADLSEDVTTVQSNNLHYEASAGFSYPLANIPEGTMIYYRAYATTADGTEYGDILTHKALGAPVVVAKYPMWRTDNSATIELDITLNDGELDDFYQMERNVYYGTDRNNLTLSEYIDYDADYHEFSVNLYDLASETKYYYVAVVTNDYGTSRSDTLEFLTCGTMTDSRDNTQYLTIQIGNQTWMAQNLKYEAGTLVTTVVSPSTTEARRYYPNNYDEYVDEYGYLYNWPAAMNGDNTSNENPSGVQGICPNGWHLPSSAEWTQLINYLGGNENAGPMLAGQPAAQDQYWTDGTMITQSANFGKSGFNALPAGSFDEDNPSDPTIIFLGSKFFFWSTTTGSNDWAFYNYLGSSGSIIDYGSKALGYSVRCVKGTAVYAYDTVNQCMEQPYSYTYHDTVITTDGDYTIREQIDSDTENIYKLHIAFHPTLTANISEFSNGCFGANNGYVEVGATGGAGDYSYAWSTPEMQTSNRLENLAAGEYAVTVTDVAGCSATISQTLTAPAELTATISGNNPNCYGDQTTLTASANGGTTDYSYAWSNNETTESIAVTPTATTTYTITVTDANNCTATASKNVVVNSQLTVSISGDTQVQCFGDNTATITATASGGSMAMGYTYTWTGNATGQTLTNVGAGDYSVTVTDGNNCTASASTTIAGPNAALSVSISATNNTLTCSNSSATLTATVTGGTEDYTYTWSNSVTNNTTEVTAPGTYMVEVSDANSCTAEATQTITQDITAPTVTIDNTETELNCNRTSIALTATGNGASYVWSNGETNAATTVTTPDTYTVTVTGSNGCTNETSIAITKVENPTVEVTAGEILCNGATTTFTANVSNGKSPYSYRWQDNSTSQTLNAQAGTYSVTITDNNGCTASASTTVNVNDQTVPELTGTWPSNITGQNNCFANADISELLSNDAVEALYEDCSGITVSHTDANTSTDNCGWTITRTYTIQDPYGNTVEPNPTMSVSGSDQSAPELTGTWPANITGQDNCFANADISGLISDDDVADLYSDGCGGTVTVSHSDASTLTDNCGWTITRTYTIRDACGNETTNTMSVSGSDQSEPALAGTWPDNITGQDNCFANADLSGLISDDEAAAQYIDGCGGSVTVSHSDANTLTDNCGWTITRTYTITNACGTNSTTITQSVSGSDQSAPTLSGTWPANITAQNNCFADADVSGLMSDDDVSELYSDGCGGTISVTHTDANTTTDNCGWTITRTYTISDVCGNEVTKTQSVSGSDQTAPTIGDDDLNRQLTSINCTFIVPDLTSEVRNIASDNCTANGNLTIVQSITAGTEITTATSVVVTVTDQCGNNSTKEIELTLPTALTTSLSATSILCNGQTSNITNTVAGGTPNYTYNWNNGATTQNLEGVGSGTYSVTVTDANSCVATASVTVNEPEELTSELSAGTIACNGSTTDITNTVSGGTTPIAYEWNNGANTQNLTGVVAGTYSVTVRDNNSCSVVREITITQPNVLAVSVDAGSVACNGSTTTASAVVSGGTEPYEYQWSNSATTQTITDIIAGTYSVTVTDDNGCSTNAFTTITQPEELAVTISGSTSVCEGTTTTLTANVQGGTADFTYSWSNSATTSSITTPQLTTATEYSVTVTDANNCSASASVIVEIGDTPGITIADVTPICVGGNTMLQANVSNAGTGYTVEWSSTDTGAGLPADITTDAITVAPTSAGTYTYTVSLTATSCSDGQPFTSSDNVQLLVNGLPDAAITNNTNETTITCSTTQISLTATGGIAYQWSNGGAIADNNITSADTYTVTVTDANDCSNTESIVITEDVVAPTVSIINSTGTTLLTCTTTAINVEAQGTGTSYLWSNDTITATNTFTEAGTYFVTATAENGCSSSASLAITQPETLTATASAEPLGNDNTTNASVTVNGGTAPYNYLWSNGETSQTINNISVGTYSVTVTDANDCSVTSSVAISLSEVTAYYPARTTTSAELKAKIVGSEDLESYKFYFGTARNNLAEVNESMTSFNNEDSTIIASVSDLTAETRYYYVAEVTNRYGTSHSDTISFYTYGQMTDVDGNQYYTIQIGEQKWMAENLRATRFANGTEISLGTSISSTEPYRYYPNGDEANAAGYGYLYNWTAVMNGESSSNANPSGVQGICPNGWHVPSNAEWTQLTDYVGSQYACGGDRNQITKALSANTGWITYTTPCSPGDNQNLNNASGFNALTAGHFSGSYGAFGEGPYFWTATENDESRAYSLTWNHGTREVQVSGGNDKYGSYSIRCVKGSMTYVYDTVNFCGEEYAYHDTTYTESGDYVRQINISEDVDSTFYLHLTMFDELVATISDYNNGCYGQDNGFATVSAEGGSEPYNYAWNNGATTQTANGLGSGTYNITITDANGCIAISSVEITQPDAITSSFAETACDSYEWNGTTYTETDDYTQTFLAANGCDSIVTLHLTINNATTGIDTQVACDSYTWIDGVTYTESTDVPTFTLSNAEGCDSVVTLHLTINHSNTGIDEQTACDSYEWIDGVTYTESTDASTFTLTNAEGCDSIVTLHLTINNSNTGEFADQMCSGVPYVYEGETFTEAGTYTVTLVNSHGCDSIVTLTLTYSNTCGGIVSGIVTDENTGDAIPNAKVTIGNRVTRTNAEGQYSLEVIRGLKALRVSATGYISYSRTVDIQSDTTFNASLNSPQIHTDTDSIIVSSYPYLEQSDSITLSNNGNGTLVWSSITEYDNLELIEDSTIQRRNTRSLWDSIQTFATRENAEQAIATDGFFIYTASWMRPGEFNRYTPNGEYVETFYVENVGSIRNLSYDGTYFYGTEATNIIFKIDLDNQMLVDSIETDIPEIRHCSFNRQDGSLLAGSWNSLYRIDTASGTSQQIRDDLANVYSSAFDNLSAGGPYLWLFSQTSQNNGPSACIRQFNISTGEYTSKTHYLDDINLTNSSLAGGICASEYVCEGRFVLLADVQNPAGSNTIATYEIGCTSNVVKTGKKSGMIEPNGSESISVKANATATGDYTATIKYRAAVMGRQSNDINVSISAVAPECDAVQQISIVTDTFHTVTLDWQPVELGNYESVSYLVFNTASQFAIDTVSETTVTYDGLPVGEHCFCVMALSQAGYTCLSAASDTVCVEIEPVPCNIALAVEATNDGESIFLTWNKPVGVEYFRIHRDDNAIEEVLYDDSFVDTNVVPEVTYCYTIFAYFEDDICNEIVGTACTKIVSGVCGESPVLQIEAVGYSVHLNWTATSDSYTYKIFRNDVAIGMTTDTTYFDNVNPGYNYCYKVESLCEYGMFTYSNEECVFVEVISEDENGQGSGEGDAIDEWTADNLTLYPNPTYGQFFIDGQRIAVVQIFNATGQLVTEIENTEAEHITINCDGWNPGIYNVRIISTEGESATRKVTIFR